VYHVSIWGGLELCLGELSPPKPPVATGQTTTESTHQNEIDICRQRQKFMLIIWTFELSELCRRGVQEMVFRFTCVECSSVEVACLTQEIRHSTASVRLPLVVLRCLQWIITFGHI